MTEYKDPNNSVHLTLEEISLLLTDKQNMLLTQIEDASKSFHALKLEINLITKETDSKKVKERSSKLKKAALDVWGQFEDVFSIFKKTQHSLFQIAEAMACKQINRDPLDYLMKESFLGRSESVISKSRKQ